MAKQFRYVKDTFFIYALVDPSDKTVRYVGQSLSPRARLMMHMSNPLGARFQLWIKGLKRPPLLRILDQAKTRDRANVLERKWIRVHKDTIFNQTTYGITQRPSGEPVEITSKDVLLLAAEAQCDPRTVSRIYSGRLSKPLVRFRIQEAAEKLGIVSPPDASLS